VQAIDIWNRQGVVQDRHRFSERHGHHDSLTCPIPHLHSSRALKMRSRWTKHSNQSSLVSLRWVIRPGEGVLLRIPLLSFSRPIHARIQKTKHEFNQHQSSRRPCASRLAHDVRQRRTHGHHQQGVRSHKRWQERGRRPVFHQQ
jgi:hypothetical protein